MHSLPVSGSKKYQGQALLLILLVMSVVLSLVLSSVSRSVTDVDVSRYEDDSIRAFDAAQAGIEKSVIVGGAVSDTKVELGNDASYTPVIASASATANYFKYPVDLYSGESATLFFVEHTINADGDIEMSCGSGGCKKPEQFRFCWGRPGTDANSASTPALFIEYFYNSDTGDLTKWQNLADLSDIKVLTYSADPNSMRRNTNKFLEPVSGGGPPCPKDSEGKFFTEFDLTDDVLSDSIDGLLFVRVTMLYNDSPQPLFVRSAPPIPGQGYEITSTGQSGDVFRKLVLYQGYPEIPFEFANAVYSKSNLSK